MEHNRYESVLELIEHTFQTYAQLPAYTCLGQTVTFKQVDEWSAQFASYLQHHTDLKPGDRIALQLPNLIQFPVALYGAIRAGLVVVNTNPLYTAPELKHQLVDSGAKALVVVANVAHVATKVVAQTEVKHIIVTQVGDMLPGVKRHLINAAVKYIKKIVPPFDLPGAVPFPKVLQLGASQPPTPCPPPKQDDLFVLQYTGGTTGVAKGAMLSHGNLCANVQQVLGHIQKPFRTESEVIVAALPLYHIFAFNLHAFCAFCMGGHNILIPNPRDIKALVKAVRPFKVSTYIAVNTLYNALARNEDFARLDFSELKTSAAGGMAVTEDVSRRWLEVTGCKLCEGYGLTETSPVILTNPDKHIQAGTIGTPLMDTEIRLVNDDGEDVPDGEVGEIIVKGPQVMLGYWQRPEATNEAMTSDGFFKTGDMAVRLSNGYYKIVDRKKDMILVSGFNVYPNEIEDIATQHPNIVEAAVIGVPNEETGEAVKLFAVTDGTEVRKEDIIAHCREYLTAYKVPKLIEFVETLPKSNVGKILRRELRDNNNT